MKFGPDLVGVLQKHTPGKMYDYQCWSLLLVILDEYENDKKITRLLYILTDICKAMYKF